MEPPNKMEYYFDPNCECDAPTYVDFNDLVDQYDDNADEWFDKRAEEQDPAIESESPGEDVKESPPKVGKMQSAANALAQMIASGTGSISKLKSRILPQKAGPSKKTGPTRSLVRARIIKKVASPDKDKCNDVIKNFAKSLRSDYSKPPMATRRKVKPFVFECDKRAALRAASTTESANSTSQGQMPAAEFVSKFHTTTPPRFRRTPRVQGAGKAKQPEKDGGRRDHPGCHMTIPKTPVLHTRSRVRPVTTKGTKQLEEEELAAMKEHQFKAKAFDRRKIVDNDGLYGVPRKRGIHVLTEPHTPNFPSKSLAKKRRTVQETDGEQSSFQAKPMPDFSKVKGIPAKRPHPLTEPESPAIVKRPRTAGSSRQPKEETSTMVAKPMPKFDKLFKIKYPDRPALVPQPFSFEERDRNKPAPNPSSEDVYVFTARSVPDFSKTGLPPKPVSSPIRPAPFQLQTDVRGEKHAAKFEREMEDKRRQEKEQAEFRAKRNISSILYGKPFVPEKPRKPLLCVDNFVLHSELRGQERTMYDSQRRQRSYLLEMENLQRKALREGEDAKEIAEYRKTLVHKPQPIVTAAPVLIKSTAMPTVPVSPKFETDRVLRNRKYH